MSDKIVSEGCGVNQDMVQTWSNTAAIWNRITSPARPAPEDISFCTEAIGKWSITGGSPRVLLMGVTPEFYHLPWPEGTDLIAVDNNTNMIHAIWPGPMEMTRCMDWLDMDFPESSRDVAYLDGGLTQLSYPQQQRVLAQRLNHILSDGGLVIFRLVAPPNPPETLQSIVEAARRGEIKNVQVFVLRLMVAMQNSAAEGMNKSSLRTALENIYPDIHELCESLCTPDNQNNVRAVTHGLESRFHFVSVNEVVDLFCNQVGGFELLELRYPSYEMGHMCPTLILQRRRQDAKR